MACARRLHRALGGEGRWIWAFRSLNPVRTCLDVQLARDGVRVWEAREGLGVSVLVASSLPLR